MDINEEISEIKKEIVESRALSIRTNNLMNSLAADIKAIAKKQAGYERRININSAVAYIIYTVLIFLGLKMAFDWEVAKTEKEKEMVVEKQNRLKKDLTEMKNKKNARDTVETKIQDFYLLIRDNNKEQAINNYEEVFKLPLTEAEKAIFKDKVNAMRAELSLEKYQKGLNLARQKKWKEAEEYYRQAVTLKEDATHISGVRLELAISLRMQGRQKEAIVVLSDLLGTTLDREIADDAMYQLGVCYGEVHKIDEAQKTLKSLIEKFPGSQWIKPAREALTELHKSKWSL
ncbi:MAG: tetratricopeptide repeat protein [Pseudomonadota bacterium]